MEWIDGVDRKGLVRLSRTPRNAALGRMGTGQDNAMSGSREAS